LEDVAAIILRHCVIERGGGGAAKAERLVVGGERVAQARRAVFIGQRRKVLEDVAAIILRGGVIERGGVGAAEAERLVVGGERLAQARRAVFIGQRRKVLEDFIGQRAAIILRHCVIERGGVGAAEAERLVVGGERLAQARRAVFIGQRRKVGAPLEDVAAIILRHGVIERGGVGAAEAERLVVGGKRLAQARRAVFIGQRRKVDYFWRTLPRLFCVVA
jgi:hypothetical protein